MKQQQSQIIKDIAKHHGLPEYQVEEVWLQFTSCLTSILSAKRKDANNKFIESEFPIVHVDNFGKFIPRINMIRRLNKHVIRSNNEQS